ncbi:hypothetical protein C8F04DRAFT_1083470 [Mycena alexandri]|uniref:Uncharacterized protein n=1 Tax=Mycena alexandri TaxID=1745969 RepID=A0AAD6X8C7_9AGAR|nr:hypothetical protein C8F04DRAFT_1083470 [Mycena alexandri]
MPYATVRYTVPAPNHGYNLPRVRRNTMESRRQQQQQYAYEYMDDRSSFVRAQREEARKFARASKATEQGIPNAVNDWQHGGNVRRPAVEDIGRQAVPTQPPARMAPHAKHTAQRSVYPQQPVGILRPSTERARLETFKFPQAESKTYARPPPLQPYIVARSPPPLPSPNKRLAPIPRFNPFAVKRKRNVSVSALFARIHREVDNYRTRQGENRHY